MDSPLGNGVTVVLWTAAASNRYPIVTFTTAACDFYPNSIPRAKRRGIPLLIPIHYFHHLCRCYTSLSLPSQANLFIDFIQGHIGESTLFRHIADFHKSATAFFVDGVVFRHLNFEGNPTFTHNGTDKVEALIPKPSQSASKRFFRSESKRIV